MKDKQKEWHPATKQVNFFAETETLWSQGPVTRDF